MMPATHPARLAQASEPRGGQLRISGGHLATALTTRSVSTRAGQRQEHRPRDGARPLGQLRHLLPHRCACVGGPPAPLHAPPLLITRAQPCTASVCVCVWVCVWVWVRVLVYVCVCVCTRASPPPANICMRRVPHASILTSESPQSPRASVPPELPVLVLQTPMPSHALRALPCSYPCLCALILPPLLPADFGALVRVHRSSAAGYQGRMHHASSYHAPMPKNSTFVPPLHSL